MVNERSDLTVTMLRFDPERDPIVIDEWEWDNPHIAAEEEAVARGIQEAFEREPPVMFVSMTEEITTLVLRLSVFGGGDVGPAWVVPFTKLIEQGITFRVNEAIDHIGTEFEEELFGSLEVFKSELSGLLAHFEQRMAICMSKKK
jgi:hypothetical protein